MSTNMWRVDSRASGLGADEKKGTSSHTGHTSHHGHHGASEQKLYCSLHAVLDSDDIVPKLIQVLSMMIAVDTPQPLPIPSSIPTTDATKRSAAPSASSSSSSSSSSDSKLTDGLAPRALYHYERTYTSTANKEAAEIRAWRAVHNDVPSSHAANQWYIQHLGKAVQPAKTRTLVRPITLIPVGDNFPNFLSFLGYSFSFEYVQRGYIFTDQKGEFEVRLTQLWKLRKRHDLTDMYKLADLKWMVELYALCTDVQLQSTEARLHAMAKSLEPLVTFHKPNLAEVMK